MNLAQPTPTAIVRRRVEMRELPSVIQECCGLVWTVMRTENVPKPGRHVTLYLDAQVNIEVGVELQAPFAGHGEVVGSQLPVGPVATATHMGPYQNLTAAHSAIRDWCAAHGHTLAGPNWEIYGHWEEAWNNDSSLIRTDVFYLLKS